MTEASGQGCWLSGKRCCRKWSAPAGRFPAGAGDREAFGKRTCKPNSVVCGHSSRRRVAADIHQRPTRRFQQLLKPLRRVGPMRSAAWLLTGTSLPIWSCSVWGLPCPRHYCRGGALLPHLFTLTPALEFPQRRAYPASRPTRVLRFQGGSPAVSEEAGRGSRGGIFSVALAVRGI